MDKTGILYYTNVIAIERAEEGRFKELCRRDMRLKIGDDLVQLHSDGRQYVYQYFFSEYEVKSKFEFVLEVKIIVLLFNPRQAEVGEYVTLGAAETVMPQMKQFIHLGADMLFESDEIGWKRIPISDKTRIEIDNHLRRLNDEG